LNIKYNLNLINDSEFKSLNNDNFEFDDELIVLIPCYNEETTIEKAIDISKNIGNTLVIDDGSIDKSIEIAKVNADHLISNQYNQGLAVTITNGLNYGLKLGYNRFIIFDADCQYNLKDLRMLANALKNLDYDIILGSRFLGNIESMSGIKSFGNRIFSRMISFQTKIPLSDTQTGLRGFNKKFARNIKIRNDFTYTQQMIFEISKKNFKVAEFPIDFNKRKSGRSRLMKNAFHYALRAWTLNIQVFFEYNPIKISFYVAAIYLVFLSWFYTLLENLLVFIMLSSVSGLILIISYISIFSSIIIRELLDNGNKIKYIVLK